MHSRFARRRLINSALLVTACVLMAQLVRVTDIAFIDTSKLTGWVLITTIAFLFIYALRKRLSMLPLGRVAYWLQAHLYVGFFSLFVFCLHIDWPLSLGWFELALAISFIGTILSGIVGIFWSRTLPRALTNLGDEILYDRIGAFCTILQDKAEQVALSADKKIGSTTLIKFYTEYGHAFFSRPKFQWRRLYRNYNQPVYKLERELMILLRYMRKDEIPYTLEILKLVRQKEVINAHYTYQGALRSWLLIHLACSFAIIPLVSIHIVTAYSFG